MKPTPQPRMTPSAPAARGFTAAGRLLPLILALAATAPLARAVLPNPPGGLANNALFKKGYLDVTLYADVAPASPEDINTRTARTIAINTAIKDARDANLALYFPLGTYEINDTLKAHTEWAQIAGDPNWAYPRKHVVMIGETPASGTTRPVIKIAGAAPNFSDALDPHPVLEFKNFIDFVSFEESPSRGYYQMLRGIDINCNGRAGAIGLYFNQAQDSSVENVKVIATNAYAGIQGLPGRCGGAVNIEIEGGQFGLDLRSTGVFGTQNSGTVVAGVKLLNQTVNAVAFDGFVPLTIVGFEIEAAAGSSTAAITVLDRNQPNESIINLVDGTIKLADATDAAIDNQMGRTFYARDVYVYGTQRMVRTGPSAYATYGTSNASWKWIKEYRFTDPIAANIPGNGGNVSQATYTSVGVSAFAATPTEDHIFANGTPDLDPATGIRAKHAWGKLPSVDDNDAWDPVEQGQITLTNGVANITTGTLNGILANHSKVFLPKGVYRLNGGTNNVSVVIPENHVLFGAARNLTKIEVQHSVWKPTSETAMITTTNSATSTAYLGDLIVGVDTYDDQNTNTTAAVNDWFTAVWWQAGKNSMVHMGQPYRAPATDNDAPTNDHSLVKITGNGGGRWYFFGARKAGASNHPNFRILEVKGASDAKHTTPLWFYGLNLEHPRGSDYYAEFLWTDNVRIYCGKTEYPDKPALGQTDYRPLSGVIRFNFCDNVALYGMGAIRNGLAGGKGNIELYNSTNSLVTSIAPQRDDLELTGDFTFRSASFTSSNNLAYPNVVSVYRAGNPSETSMTHAAVNY